MTDIIKSKGSFDWLAAVIYPLAVVLMEVFWVYPWLFWLGNLPAFGAARPVLSLASVIITLVASLLVTRLTLRRELEMWRTRVIIIGSGLVVIFIVLAVEYRGDYPFLSGEWLGYIGRALANTFGGANPVVLAIPALLYLWWRGIVLGQTTSYFKDVYRTFALGMAALIVLVILWQISSASERFIGPGVDIGWYIMAFFFFGLTAIAICHIYLMRSSMAKEEAARTSPWRWLPITIGVIGVMVLVAFGLAGIFSPELFDGIARGFRAIGGFLGTIIGYILMPVIWVLGWLVRLVVYLLRLLSGSQEEQPPGDIGGTPEWGDITPAGIPPWVTETVKWVVVALIIAGVVYFLAKAVSRLRSRRAREDIEEIHESLFSWKGLRDDLKELLGMMGNRFKRKPAEDSSDGEESGGLDIRRIYRQVLREGARSGIPRRQYETPEEYALRVNKILSVNKESLDELTRWYEHRRYGDLEVAMEQLMKAQTEGQIIITGLRSTVTPPHP